MKKNRFEIRFYITEKHALLIADLADELGMGITEYVKYLITNKIELFFAPLPDKNDSNPQTLPTKQEIQAKTIPIEKPKSSWKDYF